KSWARMSIAAGASSSVISTTGVIGLLLGGLQRLLARLASCRFLQQRFVDPMTITWTGTPSYQRESAHCGLGPFPVAAGTCRRRQGPEGSSPPPPATTTPCLPCVSTCSSAPAADHRSNHLGPSAADCAPRWS